MKIKLEKKIDTSRIIFKLIWTFSMRPVSWFTFENQTVLRVWMGYND